MRQVGVPRGTRFTFTRMEPSSPDDRGEPLTVSFDEVQGPYRRRMILAGLAVAVLVLVLVAAWRLVSAPRPVSPRPPAPHVALKRAPRRSTHRRVAVNGPPRAWRRSGHRVTAATRKRGLQQSAIAPDVMPPRPTSDGFVGAPRPPSQHRVGQRIQRQFQYLGR